jgi:3-dehydroquinate dehydratase-1
LFSAEHWRLGAEARDDTRLHTMSAKKISHDFPAPLFQRQRLVRWPANPPVVGTVYSSKSLQRALRLTKAEVDFFELRVDHFSDDPERLLRTAPRLRAPLIVTVRPHDQGGAGKLSARRRNDLFARFLSLAHLIDVELRSVAELKETISAARVHGLPVIISDHDFHSTPSAARLLRTLHRAEAAGADIVKIAAHVSESKELGRLLSLFTRRVSVPLSVMGMGPLGKLSRLLFACAGSVLNYGYLGEPQVPGQWEATLLKKRLGEILAY